MSIRYDSSVTFWRCGRCKRPYVAGHICGGPEGTPLERAIQRLELGERLSNDERAAVLAKLIPPDHEDPAF